MASTRRNVWTLGSDWADPILWYARGVKAMKARALNERTSWRFYAAIHGIFPPLWQQYGYLSAYGYAAKHKPTGIPTGTSVSTAAGIFCPGTAAI